MGSGRTGYTLIVGSERTGYTLSVGSERTGYTLIVGSERTGYTLSVGSGRTGYTLIVGSERTGYILSVGSGRTGYTKCGEWEDRVHTECGRSRNPSSLSPLEPCHLLINLCFSACHALQGQYLNLFLYPVSVYMR